MESVLPDRLLMVVMKVLLLRWGLEHLQQNIEKFSYNNTNFLSCMTLDVENLHVSVHHKN